MDAITRTESDEHGGAPASAPPNGRNGHGNGDAGRNGHDEPMPVRQASLAVADAIEGVLHAQESRHAAVDKSLAALRERQTESEHRQQGLAELVASIADRQQTGEAAQAKLQARQDQIAASVDTILTNQKTSSKCYQEVMAALTAIAHRQQATDEQVAQLTEHVDRRATRLINTFLVVAAALAGLAIINVVLALV